MLSFCINVALLLSLASCLLLIAAYQVVRIGAWVGRRGIRVARAGVCLAGSGVLLLAWVAIAQAQPAPAPGVTRYGSVASGDCVEWQSATQIKDAGSACGSGGGGGVTSIVAGSNVTISPSGGTGNVTINATGGGSSVIVPLTLNSSNSISTAVYSLTCYYGTPALPAITSGQRIRISGTLQRSSGQWLGLMLVQQSTGVGYRLQWQNDNNISLVKTGASSETNLGSSGGSTWPFYPAMNNFNLVVTADSTNGNNITASIEDGYSFTSYQDSGGLNLTSGTWYACVIPIDGATFSNIQSLSYSVGPLP